MEQVATPQGFVADPALVWRFYSERRTHARRCQPNPGHFALAQVEKRLGDRFLLATQNIDGLHAQAGSQRVVEMHGSLFKTRCSRCDRAPFFDDATYDAQTLPACGNCDSRGEFALLRPHIVWFGELLDSDDLDRINGFIERASRGRFVFLAVGTSGAVYPAAGLVDVSARAGADTWLVNADPPENRRRFNHFVRGPSGALLPKLLVAPPL